MVESEVKDISQAEWGRKEMLLAEIEMPGLMSCREEFGESKPLKGARVMGSLHMTIQTAVLIETLENLGGDIRWCSCNIYSTQDHAAAAIAKTKTAVVYAWKGENLHEYWECTMKALTWPNGQGPNIIVDDGGDATLLLMKGVEMENEYEKTKKLPDPSTGDCEDEQELLGLIKRTLENCPGKFKRLTSELYGVSEETTTGVARLNKLDDLNQLICTCINVNDSVTKSKFDNIYGCRHSLADGINRATDVLISGKKVVICGFGDVGKGCASAMRAQNARVYVTEIDPICALQACMEGYTVVTLEKILHDADIFITTTGCKNVITGQHMEKMKNNAIVGNIGHFDNEIDMAGLKKIPGVVKTNIKDMLDRWQFPDKHGVLVLAEGRLLNLGCATGHPSFVMSCSFTNQVMAQMELWSNRDTGKYQKKLYRLPKELDEKVARLHLGALGAELTMLSNEQSNYMGINKEGPYKNKDYKY